MVVIVLQSALNHVVQNIEYSTLPFLSLTLSFPRFLPLPCETDFHGAPYIWKKVKMSKMWCIFRWWWWWWSTRSSSSVYFIHFFFCLISLLLFLCRDTDEWFLFYRKHCFHSRHAIKAVKGKGKEQCNINICGKHHLQK